MNAFSSFALLRTDAHFRMRRSFSLLLLLTTIAANAQTYTQRQTLGDYGPYAFAGWSTAISGHTLLVGGPAISSAGAVYAYQDYSGYWVLFDSFVSPASADGDLFGASVAIDGNTIVVGSPGAALGSGQPAISAGRAYVYSLSTSCTPTCNESISLDVPLEETPPQQGDQFGFSVAVSGNVIAVGAPYADASGGAVYVYQRTSASSNVFGITSLVGYGDAGDEFGYAVATDGTQLLIGVPNGSVTPAGTTYHSGRAYFFTVQSNGQVVYNYYVGAASPADGRRFGSSVAINSANAAVGAPVSIGGPDASVDVFTKDGTGTYRFTTEMISPSPEWSPKDDYGDAVAFNGTLLAVGAQNENDGDFAHIGDVYVYARDQGGANNWGLTQTASLDSCTIGNYQRPNGYIQFGASLAFEGNTLAAGGPLAGNSTAASTGAVFVFSADEIFHDGFDPLPIVLCP